MSNARSLSPEDRRFDPERARLHQQILPSIAHDLKSPLASIIGSLEIYERMKDKLAKERQDALIHIALLESYRLDALITNVVDMMKLDEGAVEAQLESVDIGDIMQKTLLRFSSQLQDCLVRAAPNPPVVHAVADPALLAKAVGIVLDNAIKFAGSPPTITTAYGEDGGRAFISIHDNGDGVADEHKEAIFEKYTRFLKEGHKSFGAGLGLAICRDIMQLLRGDVTVVNHGKGGAVFTLRIPTA